MERCQGPTDDWTLAVYDPWDHDEPAPLRKGPGRAGFALGLGIGGFLTMSALVAGLASGDPAGDGAAASLLAAGAGPGALDQ